jgi:predicted transcriptional regulator of viral defense system
LTITEYIHQLQSFEEYAFSWKEVLSRSDKTETSLKRELSRLVKKKEIINLRKEFYLIIPPRYSKQGQLPIQLYINKLFKSLNRNYYLGFYSAAKFHGANHQQAQQEYVMIENPKLGDIKKTDFQLRYFTTTKWPIKNIQEKKSDAGIFKISSPALTAVDLIHHQTKLGGLNRMLAILEELFEEISANDISDLLTWYSHISTLQRFGFLLQELHAESKLIESLSNHLSSSKFYPVLLTPKSGQKPGAVNNDWKVDINIKLESDL